MTQQLATRRVTAGAFTREAVEALSRHNNEPQWLLDQRRAAWEHADRLPFPTGYERAWKYLNPDRVRVEAMEVPDATTRHVQDALSDDARSQGVIATSLDAAVRDHPQLVQKHLGSVIPADESVFVALNAALWSGGVFVYVPKDVKVQLPLQAVLTAAGDHVGLFPRVLVVVERGAEVAVIDHHTGGEGPLFASAVTEIVLGDEAKLQHFGIQTWGQDAQELFFQRATLGRNARLLTTAVGLGGSIHKGWIESAMKGTGATSEILGVVFGTGDQYFDVITLQDHIGEHTVSDLLIKSALKDASQSAYYGLTRINRFARMSDANQEDRNLLLSDKAKAEADPVLEILTSEVARCAHGASAGPVDQEQLFYLECRGLPRPEAEKLLVQGFLGQVIERIPVAGVRETVEAAVLAKLG
jgi:Fe-S cluster assembly protein SufD